MMLTNEKLHQVADEVPFGVDVSELVEGMTVVLVKSKTGVAIAANQVGETQRVIIVHLNGLSAVMINPVIVKKSGRTKLSREGCLSFPGKMVNVKRDPQIVVDYFDQAWQPVRKKCRGLPAFCVQHEIDHLNGVTI